VEEQTHVIGYRHENRNTRVLRLHMGVQLSKCENRYSLLFALSINSFYT